MSILNTLKLSDQTRAKTVTNPTGRKREKLITNLERQIKAVEADDNGECSTFLAARVSKNPETGESVRREVSVKVRPWWYRDISGAYLTSVKYGNRKLELAKGKQAIQVGERKNLIPTYQKLIEAVRAGEFDALMKSAAKFGK